MKTKPDRLQASPKPWMSESLLKLKMKFAILNLCKYSDTLKLYILKTQFQSLDRLLATYLLAF